MRKIEQNMIERLTIGKAFNSGNTTVSERARIPDGYIARVYLHGNEIARLYFTAACRDVPFYMTVSLAGWNTVTTRSRLSALIKGFNRAKSYPDGLGVSTRKGQAYLHDANGKRTIDNDGWHVVQLGE